MRRNCDMHISLYVACSFFREMSSGENRLKRKLEGESPQKETSGSSSRAHWTLSGLIPHKEDSELFLAGRIDSNSADRIIQDKAPPPGDLLAQFPADARLGLYELLENASMPKVLARLVLEYLANPKEKSLLEYHVFRCDVAYLDLVREMYGRIPALQWSLDYDTRHSGMVNANSFIAVVETCGNVGPTTAGRALYHVASHAGSRSLIEYLLKLLRYYKYRFPKNLGFCGLFFDSPGYLHWFISNGFLEQISGLFNVTRMRALSELPASSLLALLRDKNKEPSSYFAGFVYWLSQRHDVLHAAVVRGGHTAVEELVRLGYDEDLTRVVESRDEWKGCVSSTVNSLLRGRWNWVPDCDLWRMMYKVIPAISKEELMALYNERGRRLITLSKERSGMRTRPEAGRVLSKLVAVGWIKEAKSIWGPHDICLSRLSSGDLVECIEECCLEVDGRRPEDVLRGVFAGVMNLDSLRMTSFLNRTGWFSGGNLLAHRSAAAVKFFKDVYGISTPEF